MPESKTNLQADIGHSISRLAIAMATEYFRPEHKSKREAYEMLAKNLFPDMTLIVLAEKQLRPQIEDWLKSIDISCKPVVAALAENGSFTNETGTAWIQDRFLCASRDQSRIHLIPSTNNDAEHGRLLAEFENIEFENIEDNSASVHLEGGDCLVGEEFWLVGAKSVELTAALPGQLSALDKAEEKIAKVDGRPLHIVGYYPSDIEDAWERATWFLSEARAAARAEADQLDGLQQAESSPAKRPIPGHQLFRALKQGFSHFSAPRKLYQPWHHIDLMVSVTGETRFGKPLLLVADPMMPPCPLEEESRSFSVRLGATVKRLLEAGFAVERNPAPYIRNKNDPSSSQRPRGYNNVLVQNKPNKIVWLPHFGDKEDELKDVDAANRKIWEDLGFEVVPVPGWSALARNKGALRCAVKVLSRTP